jgi:hypothetical protein
MEEFLWCATYKIVARKFQCGYCGSLVSANEGYPAGYEVTGGIEPYAHIYICPGCNKPTFFDNHGFQTPGVGFGDPVKHLPLDLQILFDEARNVLSVNGNTSSVILCRKIMMHIGVDKGASPKLTFQAHVEHLINNGHIPHECNAWVDEIRVVGNEANHDITPSTREDAELMVQFVEFVLKIVYENPGKLSARIAKNP